MTNLVYLKFNLELMQRSLIAIEFFVIKFASGINYKSARPLSYRFINVHTMRITFMVKVFM